MEQDDPVVNAIAGKHRVAPTPIIHRHGQPHSDPMKTQFQVPQHANTDDDRTAPPRAPLRVMEVIAMLAEHSDGLSLGELSEGLRVPKTSLFSLLRSLEAGGYVDSNKGHHRLGQTMLGLAALIQRNDRFPGNLRPMLEELHEACDETVLIGIPSKEWQHLIYVDVIEADSGMRYSARIGGQRPLYCTSLGLTMLAFATPEQQELHLSQTKLERINDGTLTSKKAVLQALRQIRAEGYCVSSGAIDETTGVSAPLLDAEGRLYAAVGMAGLTVRYERKPQRFAKLVMDCGQRMSRRLGYTGAYPKPV